jgi:hypothetical protein
MLGQDLPTGQEAEKERDDYGKKYIVVQIESAGETQPGKFSHRCRRMTAPARRHRGALRRFPDLA